MAKNTGPISKSDIALNNWLRDIANINRTESRGESTQNLSHFNKPLVKQKPDRAKCSALTHEVATRLMRAKRVKVSGVPLIPQKELELILLSSSTGVPLEILRKNPNLRKI